MLHLVGRDKAPSRFRYGALTVSVVSTSSVSLILLPVGSRKSTRYSPGPSNRSRLV